MTNNRRKQGKRPQGVRKSKAQQPTRRSARQAKKTLARSTSPQLSCEAEELPTDVAIEPSAKRPRAAGLVDSETQSSNASSEELVPALPFCIPPCIWKPPHRFHPPPAEQPLRIFIWGPIIILEKLFPDVSWHVDSYSPEFPMPGGPKLAELAFQHIYHRKVRDDIPRDMVVRDEYIEWDEEEVLPFVNCYGVTFDHLVPLDDTNPEVVDIGIWDIVEIETGKYVIDYEPGKEVSNKLKKIGVQALGKFRCCIKRKGPSDRKYINDRVNKRMGK